MRACVDGHAYMRILRLERKRGRYIHHTIVYTHLAQTHTQANQAEEGGRRAEMIGWAIASAYSEAGKKEA